MTADDFDDETDIEVDIVECMYCGEPVQVLRSKHTMPHHDGCAGYPYCSCKTPHKGDCPK